MSTTISPEIIFAQKSFQQAKGSRFSAAAAASEDFIANQYCI
jgi:hypothetical protein